MVTIFFPTAADTGSAQERTGSPSTCTVQAPQTAMPQPYLVPGQAELVAQHPEQRHLGFDVDGAGAAVHVELEHGRLSPEGSQTAAAMPSSGPAVGASPGAAGGGSRAATSAGVLPNHYAPNATGSL